MRRRVRRSVVWAATAALMLLATAAALAAGGALDTSFSSDGKVRTDLSTRGDFAAAVAVQTDGKIVVAGGSAYDTTDPKWALTRYQADGTLDTSFGGGDGKVITNFTDGEDAVYGLAIQSDGKIIAAGDAGLRTGNSKFGLARYEADGKLDDTFSGDGKVMTNFTTGDDPVSSLVLQTGGELVVAGGAAQNRANPKVAIARYLADGSLDPSFGGGDGKVTTDFSPAKDYANAVVLQTDGKIVAGGIAAVSGSRGSFELIRYNPDGTLDNTFSVNAKLTTNFTTRDDSVQGVVVRSDGDIVAGGIVGSGSSNAKFALARYHSDGTLNTSFGGGDGKVTTDITGAYDAAWDIVLQPDEKVVAGGEASGSGGRFAAARYLADGTLDLDFGGGDGKETVNFTRRADFAIGLAAQPADGNLVLVGGSGWGGSNPKFAVARLLDE
jgi:uncharacterized delta-60 repeat protein